MKASEGIQNYKAKVKECVNYCVKEIKYVCKEVGGRESGSPAERKAQEHMADELRKYTDSVELEEFDLHPKAFMGWVIIVGLCMIASVILYNLGFALISLILTLVGAVCMIAEFLMYKEFLDPFFPKRTSANVIAIRKPEGEVKRRIIFNGHCDSAYEWRYTYLGGGHLLVAVIAIAIVGLVVTLVCEIAALATGHAMTAFEGGFWKIMGYVQLVWIPSYISILFFTHWKLVVPGANDNLTGCVNAMAVMKYLSDNGIRFENTEVRAVLTGSEEAGLRGAKAYAKRHKEELLATETVVLGLDTFRDLKDLAVYDRDLSGTLKHDKQAKELVKNAASNCGLDLPYASIYIGACDAAAFTQIGVKATGFAAMDPTPPRYYHTRLDSWELLEPEAIRTGIEVVTEACCMYDAVGLK